MKRALLLTFAGLACGSLMAQDCLSSINTTSTEIGFDPNPIVGSTETQVYNESIAIVLPGTYDTEISGNPVTIPLCGLAIISISGLPSDYSWEIWAIRVFSAFGTVGSHYQVTLNTTSDPANKIDIETDSAWNYSCLRIQTSSPAPAPANPGPNGIDSVDINVTVRAWGDMGFGCMDLYSVSTEAEMTLPMKLPMKSAAYIGIEEQANPNVFGIYENFPNPASESTYITFTTPFEGNLVFGLYDGMGRLVRNANIQSKQGFNAWQLDLAGISTGLYSYSLTYDNQTISRKLIVNK